MAPLPTMKPIASHECMLHNTLKKKRGASQEIMMTKWIVLNGMISVDQAEYLVGVLSVGNDPDGLAGSLQEQQLVEDIEAKLNRAIGHIKNEGFAGSGVVVEGNNFLSPDEETAAECFARTGDERLRTVM